MQMVEVTQNIFSSLKLTFSQRMEEIGHIRPLKGCPNWLNYQVWGGEVWMFHYAWMGLIWKCGILLAYSIFFTTSCHDRLSNSCQQGYPFLNGPFPGCSTNWATAAKLLTIYLINYLDTWEDVCTWKGSISSFLIGILGIIPKKANS